MREPSGILRKASGVVLVAALLGARAARAVEVEFVPLSPADQWDTRTYRAIWDEFGDRIVAAFETVTCLPFVEPHVGAVVANDVSHSGGPEHPMQLRATYARAVKQATLVHELGHRHCGSSRSRSTASTATRPLYLVLDRVWAQRLGRGLRRATHCNGVRLARELRLRPGVACGPSRCRAPSARLWNELLARNGFRTAATLPPARANALRRRRRCLDQHDEQIVRVAHDRDLQRRVAGRQIERRAARRDALRRRSA